MAAGDLSRTGRLLLRYGYSRCETDAVLGMFSHDNITMPKNYELHSLSLDYALQAHTYLGLTNYFYRRAEADPEAPPGQDDWVSRTRLNLYFTF